ncbi:hypothetical protein GOBAR_DD00655 [Gossypium barbadense]|nr:hypothetical protein GOBAR_DD00655 [Gossypium barbadense]
MNVLRGIGVPESNILTLLNRQPRLLLYDPVRLKEIVEEVKRMGIGSSRMKFLVAVQAFRSMSKSTLEKKIDVYRRWGWSDQEINEAFGRYPLCMTVSEEKTMAIMDFLVNKMGYSSTLIAKEPCLVTRSLEKRIIPRAVFARELISQGLVNEFKLSTLFETSEKIIKQVGLEQSKQSPNRVKNKTIGGFWRFNRGRRTSLLHGRQAMASSQNFNLSITKISTTLRFFSISSNEHSFTVSYLINKCGFSPESASRTSNYVHFETPEKPDSLIIFLDNHGFSKTQIKNLIKRQPKLLYSDTEKTLLPKLEFLYSIGFSMPELAKLLSDYPTLLRASLEKRIIPSFNLLRNLFQSDDKAIKSIKRFAGILVSDFEKNLLPNMNILRGIGVPESNILLQLHRKPRTLMFNPVRLEEIVEEVKRMGIDTSRKKFLDVVFAMKSMTKSTLEKKIDVYKRWGWSDQEIHEAFRRYPLCMTVSEDKIMAIMDFLVNKMGYSSTLVAKQSSVLSRSLEKRIVPRALFAQELSSKGLVNDFKLSVLFDTSEKTFNKMFGDYFVKKAPELLKLYKENVEK